MTQRLAWLMAARATLVGTPSGGMAHVKRDHGPRLSNALTSMDMRAPCCGHIKLFLRGIREFFEGEFWAGSGYFGPGFAAVSLTQNAGGKDGRNLLETLVRGQRNVGRVHGHAPLERAHNDLGLASGASSGGVEKAILSSVYLPGGSSR